LQADGEGWSPGIRVVRSDAQTGVQVIELSGGAATTHHPYVYCRGFDAAERTIVVCSDRSGEHQLYQIRIDTGEVRVLTDVRGLQWLGHAVSPDGCEAVYGANDRIFAVDLVTRANRCVADFTAIAEPGSVDHRVTVSSDGELGFVSYRGKTGKLMLASIDFAAGKSAARPPIPVFELGWERITHLLLRPGSKSELTYNPVPDLQDDIRQSPDRRARVRKIDLVAGTDVPFFVAPPGMRATHEWWAPDGSRLYTHLKTVPGWTPVSVVSVDGKTGLDQRTHLTSATRLLGHSSVNHDQSQMVTDNQAPNVNELLLTDLRTGEVRTLCWPNASGRPHPNHVHPMFSPSGRYVLYTSDQSGFAQTCLIDLEAAGVLR
jgi:oligogalacturonide lyase